MSQDINAQLAQITESLAQLAALQTQQAQALAAVQSPQATPTPPSQEEMLEKAAVAFDASWQSRRPEAARKATALLDIMAPLASNDVTNSLAAMFEKTLNQCYYKMRSQEWKTSQANNPNPYPGSSAEYTPDEETPDEAMQRLEGEVDALQCHLLTLAIATEQYLADMHPRDPNNEWAQKASFSILSGVNASGKMQFTRLPIKSIRVQHLTRMMTTGYFEWSKWQDEYKARGRKDWRQTTKQNAYMACVPHVQTNKESA